MPRAMLTNASVLDFKRISDSISDPLTKTYLAGGLKLSLLMVGALLMLTAFYLPQSDPMRYIVLAVETIFIFFVVAYVYVMDLGKVRRARANVVANKKDD